ncbi:cell division protein FtsA [Niallia nealsonii]|uniref:Cell division protein n=1 Tax=Niallia nealsonii TaxID=115979 RepID=A0A2N0Z635_9BACI|nr:cell division protein FtsA [Niallia nealsonii]PKG24960.1 cell division protein [Niallia nealsonii]
MHGKDKIFALDIGTRSVVGIILEKDKENYHVVDILSIEHKERAMLDGQIHDVLAVSKIILEIKSKLEKKYGPLYKVSVAAAGRALKTKKSSYSTTIKGKPMITQQDILHMELTAVQNAQSAVAEKNNQDKSQFYYCVGYSVLRYLLDDQELGNLIDQQGNIATVEIIATFLPRIVVESLIAALNRANLEMEALTLEPIAAINVLIPPSMRRLNVALVDIGAGTSDIAITDSGTVIAYGMVPIAGDEITEAISDQYLLDFPLAEAAKKQLSEQEVISVTDILGFTTELSREEAITSISPALEKLSDHICKEILALNNHKPPKAVMLVGGGSQTPALPNKIAEMLHLPSNRVAIRGIDAITHLTFKDASVKGPELVTPVGIAIAAGKTPVQYKTVYVNEQPVRLFEINKLTVGDCLLASGINLNKLYGKPGNAMIVSVNNQQITIPGTYGEAPVIIRNGTKCSLDDMVENGEELTVYKGKDGQQAVVQIKELLDEVPEKSIQINGEIFQVTPTIICNGLAAAKEKWVEDRDTIDYIMPNTIKELLHSLQLDHYMKEVLPFRLTINDKDTVIPAFSGSILRNGLSIKLDYKFDHEDEITIKRKKAPTVKELAELKHVLLYQILPVTFNEKKLTLTKQLAQFKRNDHLLPLDTNLYNGDKIIIEQKPFNGFFFQDLFAYIQIDMPQTKSGTFELIKNGEKATFLTPLKKGDDLQLIWPANTPKN